MNTGQERSRSFGKHISVFRFVYDINSNQGRTAYTLFSVTLVSINYNKINKTYKLQLTYEIKYALYKIWQKYKTYKPKTCTFEVLKKSDVFRNYFLALVDIK